MVSSVCNEPFIETQKQVSGSSENKTFMNFHMNHAYKNISSTQQMALNQCTVMWVILIAGEKR